MFKYFNKGIRYSMTIKNNLKKNYELSINIF